MTPPTPLYRAIALSLLLVWFPALAHTTWQDTNKALVDDHTIPRYEHLAQTTSALDQRARELCSAPTDIGIQGTRSAFVDALSAWNSVSHIRFGPVESDRRFYRFQLWPDKRNTGQRQVRQVLADSDDSRLEPAVFAQQTVAIQGLSALEMLLYPTDGLDPNDLTQDGASTFRCRMIQAITSNLAQMAAAVLADWTRGDRPYRLALLEPQPADGLLTDDRLVSAEFLKSMTTQIQLIHDHKLMEPLGPSLESAKPKRAESWRSARSLANICTNLAAVQEVYALGFSPRLGEQPDTVPMDQALAQTMKSVLDACKSHTGTLEDGVRDPDRRPDLENLRDLVGALKARAGRDLADALGLNLGFNSLDGD